MKGAGTNDSVLINIMGNRSKEHLHQVQLMYENLHKKTLEHDIRGDTSLNYGKLLRYLLLLPLQLKITYLRDSMKGKFPDLLRFYADTHGLQNHVINVIKFDL